MKYIAKFSLIGLAIISQSKAAVLINEIDLDNNRVELVNTGATLDIRDWYWCNRFNGSPSYDQVDDRAVVLGGLSTPGTTFQNFAAGTTLVLQFTSGNFTPTIQGELGLYTTNSAGFGTGAAGNLEDYVSWGVNATRDNVAAIAGEWVNGQFIDVSGIAAGETIQANLGTTGVGPNEWFVGASTIGGANVIPEPSIGLLGLLSLGLLARRRR